MTQEDKQLLIQDICARLPYGVICKDTNINVTGTLSQIGLHYDMCVLDKDNGDSESCSILKCKPYLFPLKSMTDEQCEELRNLIYEHFTLDDDFNEGIRFKTYGDILVWLDEKPINKCYFIFDWFHKNNFDYRGLIPKGSAIDATNLNIY